MRARLANLDRRLLTILMIVFVQMVGASMVLPVLPLFAQRRFEMSPEVISLLLASFFIAQFLAGPYIGRLSDRYGRVPVLIVSQIGTVISFFIIAYAQSIPVLFFARILDGVTGGNIIVAQAYVTDISPKDRRTQYLGLIFAAFGLGFIFGPALGGILSATFNDRFPFIIAGVAASLTVILTWRTLDETVTAEKRELNRKQDAPSLNVMDVIRNSPLLFILMIAFVFQFGLGLLQATFALYGEAILFNSTIEQSTQLGYSLLYAQYNDNAVNLGIGLLLTVVGAGQLFTQLVLLQRMVERFGAARLVIIGLVIRTMSTLVFAIVTTPYLGAVGSILFAIGSGLAVPSLQSLATTTVPDELRGGVLGWYQSAQSLSTIFGTALGGILFSITPTVPYWVASLLFIVILIPGIFLVRWSDRRTPAPEPIPA